FGELPVATLADEIEGDDDSEARALAWGELVRRETRGALVRNDSLLHASARDSVRDRSARDHSVRDHSVRDHSVRAPSPAPSARNAEVVELPLDRPVAMIRPRCTAGQVVAPIELADGTYVASGSTLTESVEAKDSFVIARERQVTKPGYAKKYKRK
ncbi:MAG TPA: hypothetical protein PLH57_10885, partial [Oligoflexia bacterium]|nr:hypothetical protein [Oligoflexia bacterium]